MRKTATLIALAVAMTALMGATGNGCSSSAPNGDHTTVPAKAPGRCETTLNVARELSRVVGVFGFDCKGVAVLTVNVSLLWRDPHGDGSYDPQKTLPAVNSALQASPVIVSAPCLTGTWKLRIYGEEMGAKASIPVDTKSAEVDIAC